jgi:peptidoglycan hydrolase FlgJ
MTLPIRHEPKTRVTPSEKMSLSSLTSGVATDFSQVLSNLSTESSEPANPESASDSAQEPLRQAFHQFVGQTFFSQMLSSLRSTQEGAAYFHGGQAEKIFQGQLDQVLSEELTKSSADQIADPMFRLFQLQRAP